MTIISTFNLLKNVPDLACSEPGDGNLIVEGDKLVAVTSVLRSQWSRLECSHLDVEPSQRSAMRLLNIPISARRSSSGIARNVARSSSA